MNYLARLGMAAVLVSIAAPAFARPDAGPRGARSQHSSAQFQVHFGRQTPNAPATFKFQVTPHKPGPVPAPTPAYNPLKRRRIAMPWLDPETTLAF